MLNGDSLALLSGFSFSRCSAVRLSLHKHRQNNNNQQQQQQIQHKQHTYNTNTGNINSDNKHPTQSIQQLTAMAQSLSDFCGQYNTTDTYYIWTSPHGNHSGPCGVVLATAIFDFIVTGIWMWMYVYVFVVVNDCAFVFAVVCCACVCCSFVLFFAVIVCCLLFCLFFC